MFVYFSCFLPPSTSFEKPRERIPTVSSQGPPQHLVVDYSKAPPPWINRSTKARPHKEEHSHRGRNDDGGGVTSIAMTRSIHHRGSLHHRGSCCACDTCPSCCRCSCFFLALLFVTVNLMLQRFAILSNDSKDTSGVRGSSNSLPSPPPPTFFLAIACFHGFHRWRIPAARGKNVLVIFLPQLLDTHFGQPFPESVVCEVRAIALLAPTPAFICQE